jgi:hypothetical protein
MGILYGRAGRLTAKKRWFPARAVVFNFYTGYSDANQLMSSNGSMMAKVWPARTHFLGRDISLVQVRTSYLSS